MTLANDWFGGGMHWRGALGMVHQPWFAPGQRRLDQIFKRAPELPFDDGSKIILLSDAHRGDRGVNDEFAPNEDLFVHALSHYATAGFTYIELGDGDDLWQTPRFSDIEAAYPRVFALLHQFKQQNRLHLILGNHEVQGRQYHRASKGEWTIGEGLVLRYRHTGQRLFAVHGHQVDFWCDQLSLLTQQLVWSARRRSQYVSRTANTFATQQRKRLANFATGAWARWYASQQQKQTQQMIDWVRSRHQPAIVGHTHLPQFPSRENVPCFNTGSCINPGYLTGIEIQNGLLRFVKWFATGTQAYQCALLAPERQIAELI
jgi:UDP-2,3-diacylglucosamine pyrophosphatase LpxH